jgi:hypothetical protein
MTADLYPPRELQRLWGYESHQHPNPELYMRKRIAAWCAEQAGKSAATAWPEPITHRPPTEMDADRLGYVQYLDERGFWSIRYWYNVALHGQPWLHTLSFTMDGNA